MIKSYSVVALAALLMVGCNSGSKKENNDTSSPKSLSAYSDAEKLAYAIANKDAVLKSPNTSKSTKSRTIISCESGTMEILYSIPLDQVTEDIEPTEIKYNQCKQDGEIYDGGMKMEQHGDTTVMSFPEGFSITGGEEPGSVKAGGRVEMREEGEWEVSTINMEMNINGVIHGGEDLVYWSKDFDDGNSIEYPVSGKEKIGTSTYFTVDPSYDASATPFKTDDNDDLLSGLFKYIDDKQHNVELEITAKNIVTVRVDEDGNGAFVGDEISTIKLR